MEVSATKKVICPNCQGVVVGSIFNDEHWCNCKPLEVVFKSKTGVCPCAKPREAFLEREGLDGKITRIRVGTQPAATCPNCGKLWSEH